MKHMARLLMGMALLSRAVLADQTPDPACVEALEQLETLQTVAPVYKLTGAQKRLRPKTRQRQESQAQHLHVVRSPGCMQDRDGLSMMEK
jgi:hypothetical protein